MKTTAGKQQARAATGQQKLTLVVDGQPVEAFADDTIASALMRSGRLVSRTIDGRPLGVYCNIGVCHSCAMTVDGQPSVRICQTPVSDGCRVDSQHFIKEAADE